MCSASPLVEPANGKASAASLSLGRGNRSLGWAPVATVAGGGGHS